METEEIEQAAKECANSGGPFSTHIDNYRYMFIEGAKWQAERFKKDLLDAINHADAIDSLNMTMREIPDILIENLKTSLHNIKKLL